MSAELPDVAMVGARGHGSDGHEAATRELAARGKVRLTAVCDLRIERANAMADDYEQMLEELTGQRPTVRRFTSYEQMLDDGGIDSVIIATPAHIHEQQARDALKAGINVLVEKPAAKDAAAIRSLARFAGKMSERLGKALHITSVMNRRMTPTWQDLMAPLDNVLGPIDLVVTHGREGEQFFRGAPMIAGTPGAGAPDQQVVHPAGQLFDLGTPTSARARAVDPSQARHMTNGQLERIEAVVDLEGGRTAPGAKAVMIGDYGIPEGVGDARGETQHAVAIYGKYGCALVRRTQSLHERLPDGSGYRRTGGRGEEVWLSRNDGSMELVSTTPVRGPEFVRTLEDFLATTQTKATPVVSMDDAARQHEVIDAIKAAAARQAPLSNEDFDDRHGHVIPNASVPTVALLDTMRQQAEHTIDELSVIRPIKIGTDFGLAG